MSKRLNILHSHSGLERDLGFPKHTVLVDAVFASSIHAKGGDTKPFNHNGVEYVMVNTYQFYLCGGVFKNYSE